LPIFVFVMNRPVKNILMIFTLLLTGFALKAQTVKDPVILEAKIHSGMVFPVYDALSYLVQDDVYAFDLSVSFPTYGKDFWEKLYNYPRPGIGYSCWSLGNKDVFGQAHVLYGYLNIPIKKHPDKYSFNYQVSLGAAYLPLKFDILENHLNRAISSHLNIYVRFGIDGKIKILPRCELVVEAGVTHFSNGKTKSPNYGINAGTFSLGVNYLFGEKGKITLDPVIPDIGKRYVQSIVYSAGVKVYDNLLNRKYFTSTLSYNIERLLNPRRRIGMGTDFFYDGSIGEALAVEEGTMENDVDKLIRFGIHASYAIRYKQLTGGIQLGYYLYSKYTVLTNVYNRISVQYLFTNHLLGSVAIRSHMGKADGLEWGIGYYW
jgi:hypothetical protein